MIKINTSKENDKNYLQFFKINNRLDILLPNSENPRMLDAHSSRIENITETGMSLAMPVSKGFPIMLSPKEKFIGRMPLSEAVYEFTCIYNDKAMSPILMWHVSLPYDIVRNQQRQFVRYDVSIPVTLEVLEQKNEKDIGKLLFLKTKDVSAGGFKIISKTSFMTETRVLLTFEIPPVGEVAVAAKVIRVERPQKDIPVFWVAFQFIDIPPKVRDAIVQFIFKKQLEDRRKSMEK